MKPRRVPLIRSLRAYAALTRIYTAAPLALLSYGIGIAMGAPESRIITAAVAIACALAGGYAYNDLRDQAADRINRPARPLAGGVVTDREVEQLVAVLFGVAVLLALTTRSPATIALIILMIVSSSAYSDHIKHVIGLKNAFVGVWSGFLPWGAVLGGVPMATMLPAVLIVALFVTQKELVADIYDREGDAAAGVITVPVRFGPTIALGLVTVINFASLVLVRYTETAPILMPLSRAGEVVAMINTLSLCLVFLKLRFATVRAYLELQKVFQIGGCIGLFGVIAA